MGSRFCAACGAPVMAMAQQPPATRQGGWPANAPAAAWPHEPFGWGASAGASLAGSPYGAPPEPSFEAAAFAATAASAGPNVRPHGVTPPIGGEKLTARPTPVQRPSGSIESVTLASQRAGQDPELIAHGAPRILAGFLVSYSEGVGIFWPLFQGRNLVGRRGAPDLDITLEEATVSAHHGVLLAAACPGRVKLEDLGSTNGTFVGKARLAPGQRRELSDGDLLRFGAFTAIVKII